MCYRKCDCPHYLENVKNGNYNACGDCEYIKRMNKIAKGCRIGILVVAAIFGTGAYFLF